MEATVRDTLRQLIVQHGRALCDDLPRCETMLRDLCGQHEPEIALLINALKQGIPTALLTNAAGLPPPLLVDQLRQRLAKELFLATEAAQWAVETWGVALGAIEASAPTALPRARLPFEPEMVAIPAGGFLMGSPPDEPERYSTEGPQHWVQVPAFELGRYAVTFDEWDACIAAGGGTHRPSDRRWGRSRRPVINVSWDDAQQYVHWLSRATGKEYRLPSEAEWEYGCRAGTTTPFSTGRCINTDQANYNGNKDYDGCGIRTGAYLRKTQPVGSYPPNPWGLHEMHGNLFEWVEDGWHSYDERFLNLSDRLVSWACKLMEDRQARVMRGGSWTYGPSGLRSATRGRNDPRERSDHFGFRVARTLTA